jgi:hypothetical protein
MFRYGRKRAQSTAEYVIVLGLIVAAVMAMQTYVKRGFQGRVKDTIDFVDNSNTIRTEDQKVVKFTEGYQYEPYYLTSKFVTDRGSNETEDWQKDGTGEVDYVTNESTGRKGHQKIKNVSDAD